MEVGIISTQFIKPSCPTPKHLKTHKFSLLDQFVPRMYVPIVFFYTPNQSTQDDGDITPQRFKMLKQSLSEVLTRFYPFAGRIKNKSFIDCNDEGVHYIEAKASSSTFEIFNQPNFSSSMQKLLPVQPKWEESTEQTDVAMIQVTCFACGGIAIGAMVSHLIVDGPALSFFFKSWSATSRQVPFFSTVPEFDTHFSENDACFENANALAMAFHSQFMKKGRPTMRRFLFDATSISKLKAQGSSLTVPNPSRVEVVSSLIWKCAIATFKANYGLGRATLVNHVVNMRRRTTPTFPESCMGNFIWIAAALVSAPEKVELSDLVMKLRKAVTTVDHDLVKRLQNEREFVEVLKEMVEATTTTTLTSGVNNIVYTSWSNFGLYDVDFGWGKPTWVSCFFQPDGDAVFRNTVILMDTPLGDGIEAFIYFDEDDMTILQQDKELLTFSVVDPNPLQLKCSV